LREIAAALGNARAQADQSLAYMYGLSPPDLQTSDFIGPDFEEADPARALTSQFFAATGGDNWARVSLAHKHRNGQGVPRVCATASMYLEPAANEALEDFGSLPKMMPVLCLLVLHACC
jgi:TPR repeat protein